MLILLPPSETKRNGGDEGRPLRLDDLRYSSLRAPRQRALDATVKLSRNLATAAGALRLGPTQAGEAARNRALRTGPTMPALDRYDGVLFDALDAPTLGDAARAFATDHLVIASALFGLTGAGDRIPAYRLSHDSRLPGLSLVKLWREPIAALLAATPGLLLDLRSEAYVSLGPTPKRDDAVFVRVVSEDGAGRRRALNHFNKKGKGEFARALLLAGVDHPDLASLLSWAAAAGIRLESGAPGEVELVV